MQMGKGAPSKENVQAISVDSKMTLAQRQAIVAAALATQDQDAERFLQKVAERMARCDPGTMRQFQSRIRKSNKDLQSCANKSQNPAVPAGSG